jgi:hypothetical protein
MPSERELTAFYPPQYHSFSPKGFLLTVRHRVRLKRLTSLIATEDAVVLDYGCGDGKFIEDAARLTSRLTFWGYELAAKPDKRVSHGGRVTIIRGGFDDLMRELPPCDLITMNHVIEHLPDPHAVLMALYHRMNDGAVIEGQTPAADSFERYVFGNGWSGFHAPRHTVIFSREGLRAILRSANFSEPTVSAGINPAGIAVSLASLSHRGECGTIERKGLSWLMYLALATALYPLDLLSGRPGIVNYSASKAVRSGMPSGVGRDRFFR